jgi:hypothetical protein
VVTTSEQGDKVTTAFVFAVIAWRIAAREDERERIDLRTRTDADWRMCSTSSLARSSPITSPGETGHHSGQFISSIHRYSCRSS